MGSIRSPKTARKSSISPPQKITKVMRKNNALFLTFQNLSSLTIAYLRNYASSKGAATLSRCAKIRKRLCTKPENWTLYQRWLSNYLNMYKKKKSPLSRYPDFETCARSGDYNGRILICDFLKPSSSLASRTRTASSIQVGKRLEGEDLILGAFNYTAKEMKEGGNYQTFVMKTTF